METVAALIRTSVLWACLTFVAVGVGAETGPQGTRVQRWRVFELLVDGHDDDNAYVDVSLAATFESEGKKITVPGFYDGDGKYKVRFSPATERGATSFFGQLLNSWLSKANESNVPKEIQRLARGRG